MQLQLGRFGFDISTRALVVASVNAADVASAALGPLLANLVDEQPAAIEITGVDDETAPGAVAKAVDLFSGPIGVRTSDPHIADVSIAAGAAFVHDSNGLGAPSYVRIVETAGVGLMIAASPEISDPVSYLAERARWAASAGIDRERIVLRTDVDSMPALLELGVAVMVDAPSDESAAGVCAVAVTRGARVIRSNQVRATRRTIDTVSELLERRDPASMT